MKLRASASEDIATEVVAEDGSVDITPISNVLSTIIWSLVAAKANQSFKATNSKDSQGVKGSIKKAVTLVGLIVLATLFKAQADGNFLAKSEASKSSPSLVAET